MTRLQDWRLALTPAGACATPADAAALTDWIPARAPGTVAAALEAAGRWRRDQPTPLNDRDAWWRIDLPGQGTVRLGALATLCEVWIDDRLVLTSTSMFQPQEIDADGATLWLCFRALTPHLASLKGPRARWRPFMIDNQALRLVRTTLLGHMPGWCPSIDIVGPWGPVELLDTPIHSVSLQPTWDGQARLRVELEVSPTSTAPVITCAGQERQCESLNLNNEKWLSELVIEGAEPWWPHTHGAQPLYPVSVRIGDTTHDLGAIGFRSLAFDGGLTVNGQPVFCRGANWITPDLVAPTEDYEPLLRPLVEAGMNMVRVSGVGLYETPAFFQACDRLGLLVWQDFMFANFDYPAADPTFVAAAQAEARALLAATQGSPSLAILCGGSEVMQQAAMMGLPPLDWPLFDQVLPEVCAELRPDVPYIPNTPSGGALPFVANEGVTHYYGVGAYERGLDDVRRAEVKFAAECLAFANVPDAETLAEHLPVPAVHDPRWKARVPRDRGASWDFEDTREHYLQRLYGLDPARLRREDPGLYLDLSRAVTGEAMAAVFSEWRRPASLCGGGLVWTLHDLEVGAGWGVVDATGKPKPCWWALKRVLQPRQVLITDEGVNGLALHLINETAEPLDAELRLAVFGEEPGAVVDVSAPVSLAPRSAETRSAFALMGRFFDLSYAYRFGPRAHAMTLVQLRVAGEVISEAVQFAPDLGVPAGGEVTCEWRDDGRLTLTASRLNRIVHVTGAASDDWFALAPGEPKTLGLGQSAAEHGRPSGEVLAPGGRILGSYG